MSRYFLTGAVILACICFFSTIAYTCEPIDVYIGDWRKYVAVSEYGSATVDVTAVVYSGGPAIVSSWSWSEPSGLECKGIERNEYDSTATYWSNTTGRYTVWASARNASYSYDDDYAYVYVVEVDIGGSFEYIALNSDPMEVDISLLPSELTNGTVELTVSGDIAVYYDQAMNYQVPSEASWSVARDQVPSSVWVKGTSVSSTAWDASLSITYENGGTIDSDATYFTVLDVKITEPDGNPTYDHQFAFNSASTGVCEFQVTGTTGISYLDSDLKWSLEEIADPCTTLTSVPDPCVGTSVTFTYTGLPSINSEFGKKTLTLEYSNTGIKDSMDLEIFFEPEADNHPVLAGEETICEGTPNWFYYWRQGAVSALDQGDDGQGHKYGFFYEDTDDYAGQYRYLSDTLWISSSAFKETENEDSSVDLYNHRYQTNINTGENGIANTPEYSISTDDTKVLYFEDALHSYQKIYSNPDSVAITAGTNGVIDSQPWGYCGHNPTHDDAIVNSAEGQVLHTGYDGILEILGGKLNDDEWKIYEYMGRQKNINNGYGQPWYISITHGNDDWLQTDPEEHGWDEIDLTGVDPVTFFLSKDSVGIDFVDVVCTHELMHQFLFNNVVTDSDSDFIDDNYELASNYKLCPDKPDTYNMEEDFYLFFGESYPGLGDNEFLAHMSQGQGSGDSSQDWSKGGKRWFRD